MLAAALIVFREVLEAALVVTIVMAATRGMPHRKRWVSLGIAGGVLGAGVVAAMTNILAGMFNGAGQDIVNAGILFTATVLIGWHVVWMNSHGRKMAEAMRATAKSVVEGERHMSILAVVVGLAVLREGSEVVLMLQGLWSTGSTFAMLGGGTLGLVAGVLTGGLMYLGFVALPVAQVFTLTNGILVLIAAGMAAHGANFLAQADLVPSLGGHIWDTSSFLKDDSPLGQLLAALIGYIARPSGIEVLFYSLTVTTVMGLMQRAKRQTLHALMTLAVLFGGGFGFTHYAKAAEVLSPYVTKGEWEVEQQGYMTRDRSSGNQKNFVGELGYSPTPWYRVELEGEWERNPNSNSQDTRFSSFNIENTFELADPGEYWIDPGLFFETDFARDGNSPNGLIFGFLGAHTFPMFTETFNILAHKDYGPSNTPLGFNFDNQLKYRYKPWLEPGFELYSDTSGKSRFQDQQFQTGPGFFGKIYTFNGQALKYEVAYLFGATPASPDGALRWKLEYEYTF